MKALIKKDTVKELLQNFKMNVIEKSHKYIRRWFSGGEWHYKYPQKYQPECNRTKTKIDISKKTPLITGIKPLSNATEKQITVAKAEEIKRRGLSPAKSLPLFFIKDSRFYVRKGL